MSQAELVKTLKVKTGSVKRTHKELTMYEKDRDKQQAKVDKLKSENADASNVKQAVRLSRPRGVMRRFLSQLALPGLQENVAAEAAMMIPETRQRLETAFNDLQAFMVCDCAWTSCCAVGTCNPPASIFISCRLRTPRTSQRRARSL